MNQNIHTNELIKQLANEFDVMVSHNKMLETQISQQAATVALDGMFLGQLQPNPKGHANIIMLQSGTELEGPVDKRVRDNVAGKNVEKDIDKVFEKETEKEPITVKKDNKQTSKAKEVVKKDEPYVPLPPYKPLIPYPQRLEKFKKDGQFRKFDELLKMFRISIPFT